MNPRNPSVLEARAFDAEHKPTHIVFYRHPESDWILERTEDKTIVASGTLEEMLALIEAYPYARRATWAEDTLRFTPRSLVSQDQYVDVPVIPTGIPSIDTIAGLGGLPIGCLTLIDFDPDGWAYARPRLLERLPNPTVLKEPYRLEFLAACLDGGIVVANGFPSPHQPMTSAMAGTAPVILVPSDNETKPIPTGLKSRAYLRLSVQGGNILVVKNIVKNNLTFSGRKSLPLDF